MEWFCNKCNKVYESNLGQCCGIKSVEYDYCLHSGKLISGSNSWLAISEAIEQKWKNDPTFQEIEKEYINDGCYSAPRIFIAFVERLREEISNLSQ